MLLTHLHVCFIWKWCIKLCIKHNMQFVHKNWCMHAWVYLGKSCKKTVMYLHTKFKDSHLFVIGISTYHFPVWNGIKYCVLQNLPAAGEAAAEAVLSLQTRLCSTCTTSGWARSDISPAAACLWAVSRIIRAACSGTLYCSCSMLTQYCSAVGHGYNADPSQIDCKNQTTVI